MALAFMGVKFGHWWHISIWAFVVTLLFGPGSDLRAVAWPAAFSCGLGVLLCTSSEIYSTQRFSWRG